MISFSELNISIQIEMFVGDKISINEVLNKEIIVCKHKVGDSKFKNTLLTIQIKFNNEDRIIFTGSKSLEVVLEKVGKDNFPFKTTIKKSNNTYYFT